MRLRALVMKNLQAECFGGTTFHVDNGIEPKIKEGTVTIHGKFTLPQSNPFMHMPIYPPPMEKTCVSKANNVNTIMDICSHGNPCSGSNQLGYPCSGPNQIGIPCSGPNQIGIPCSGPFQIGHPCSEPNPMENTCNGPNLLGNSHTCPKQSRHSSTNTNPSPQDNTPRSVSRMSNLRAISLPSDSLVLPADHLSIPLPPEAISSHISITPSFPAAIDNILWPPKVCEVVNGKALYQNNSDHPLLVKKYSHFLILLQYVNLKICLVKRVLIS